MLFSIPMIPYFLILLLNPFTKSIFIINIENGYVRGKWAILVYILFYIYILFIILIVIFNKKNLSKQQKRVLLVFPFLTVIIIGIQYVLPEFALIGTTASTSFLIIYLNFENKQLSIDYLIALPHRQTLLDMVNYKLTVKKAENFTVLVVSLRDFKHINNKFGQPCGNECLKQISHFLQNLTLKNTLYRFSGDEFALLIDESFEENIPNIIESIKTRMKSAWIVNECYCLISFNICAVKSQKSLNTVEDIVIGIEYALMVAKKNNIEECIYFTTEMMNEVKRRNTIIEIMRARLASNSFEIYYQPILDVRSSTFLLAESLLRLKNTPFGDVPPDEFIPLAEETGLIIEITYQMLDNICKFIKDKIDDNIQFDGINLNLSGVQFQDKNLTKKIISIISKNNIPFDKIKFEITESVIINNPAVVEQFIKDMHAIGIRFGLDDFGTGYSNIATVLQWDWDTIKIDKSLIWSAMINSGSEIIINHLVSAFTALGLTVLAEGVETEEQKNLAERIGCKSIQGFLYAKPMCKQDVKKLLGAKHIREIHPRKAKE